MKGSKTQQSYEICPRKANFLEEKVARTRNESLIGGENTL
jgi:hypothetical protein